jgi:hypothetical protein
MAEPASTSAAAIFSIVKAWAIIAGVCGSIIPIFALNDGQKTTFKNALFMAVTGSSFAIFLGPWVAEYFGIAKTESLVALSWAMGVVGVYVIRTVLKWIERRGEDAIDDIVHKFTGAGKKEESKKTETIVSIELDEKIK